MNEIILDSVDVFNLDIDELDLSPSLFIFAEFWQKAESFASYKAIDSALFLRIDLPPINLNIRDFVKNINDVVIFLSFQLFLFPLFY